MTSATSGSFFIQAQATILRLCLGFALFGSAVEIHAAQPEADPFVAPGFDLLTIKIARSDTAHDRSGLAETSRLPDYFKTKTEKVIGWVTSIRWHLASEGDRASLSPRLLVESKETLIEFKPLNQSVMMVWRRSID